MIRNKNLILVLNHMKWREILSIKVEYFANKLTPNDMKAKLKPDIISLAWECNCLNLCRVTIVCMGEQLVNIQCMGLRLVVCYRVQLLRFTHTWILEKEAVMDTQSARVTAFSTHTISSPIQLLLVQVTRYSTMVRPFPMLPHLHCIQVCSLTFSSL